MEGNRQPEDDIPTRINRVFGEVAGVEPDTLGPDTELADFDSLVLVEMGEVMRELGVELEDEQLFSLETLQDVYKLFESHTEE